jgi:hypothetical protein
VLKASNSGELRRSPVVSLFLVVQVPHTSYKRVVPLFLRPRNGFMLCLERGQYVIRVILYNIIVDVCALLPALRARFDVNISHLTPPHKWADSPREETTYQTQEPEQSAVVQEKCRLYGSLWQQLVDNQGGSLLKN